MSSVMKCCLMAVIGLASFSGAHAGTMTAPRPATDPSRSAARALAAVVESPEPGRTFAEPLLAAGRPDAGETRLLRQAIEAYRAAADVEAVQPILQFLDRHPASVWKPSLLANLAVLYRHTGYLDRALDAAGEAWRLTKASADPEVRKIADSALATCLELDSSLGRTDELAALLVEVRDRPLGGHAAETASGARSSLWQMRTDPAGSFRCGPLALERVSQVLHPGAPVDRRLLEYPSTFQGTSLAELVKLAQTSGLGLHAVRREAGSLIPVPSVVHWKADHFAALVEERQGRYRVKDLTFGDDRWLSRQAVEEESTGYLLVPQSAGPRPGWRAVAESEAAGVRGRGVSANPNPGATTPGDPKKPQLPGDCNAGSDSGMPRYNFHAAVISLNVTDSPVGYRPPRGPAMRFGITYNSREDFQPSTFTFPNLGPRWNFDWLSYVEDDDPNLNGSTIRVAERGGGSYVLPQSSGASWMYGPNARGSHETVTRLFASGGTTTIGFARQYPDGSQEVYQQSDGATTMRKYFLTSVVDPAGNGVTLSYDAATMRLLSITDPLGQQTTLTYDPTDIYKVTAVTDPFGRQAVFTYSGGLLQSVTDAMGLTSSFAYGPPYGGSLPATDFMSSMTTPYGTTAFETYEQQPTDPNGTADPTLLGNTRWLLATDPVGDRERIEFRHLAPGVQQTTGEPVPAGFDNSNLAYRNTFYWNATAMLTYSDSDPNRYLNASYLQHWLHDGTGSIPAVASILESEQAQGQHRIWYSYPGEPAAQYQGTLSTPTAVAQVLDSGQTQLYTQTYDGSGRLLSRIDPVGRTYSYHYASNGIDLAFIDNDLLHEQVMAAAYNSAHRPLSYTNYAGQATVATYNSFGQLTSVTRPDGVETTITYDGRGFPTKVARVGTSYQETYTYDPVGRIETWTGTDGYTMTFGYDNLDRLTGITYPDGTSEQVVFNLRDVVLYQDRMGRATTYTYDAADRRQSMTDAAGRTTYFSWCGCGALDQMTDPLGHSTSWLNDNLNRVVGKSINGQLSVLYGFDGSGRLVGKTDALGQVTNYSYNVDNSLAAIAYQNAVHPTSGATFAYDPFYPRLIQQVDGFGTTTFTYYPAGVPGAGKIATMTAPAPNHTVALQYDAIGRQIGLTLDGIVQSRSFDGEGRLASVTNPLGTFNLSYDGASPRSTGASYPNGQGSTLTYLDVLHDFRLSQLGWGPAPSLPPRQPSAPARP